MPGYDPRDMPDGACSVSLSAFVRPFSFSLFAWTYLVPVLPFVMWFDGIVSCLRSHSLSELRELASQPVMRSHEWSCGTLCAQTSMLPVTVLIGCPKRRVNETGQSLSHLCNQHSQEQLLVASGMRTARFVPVISKNGSLERC